MSVNRFVKCIKLKILLFLYLMEYFDTVVGTVLYEFLSSLLIWRIVQSLFSCYHPDIKNCIQHH